MTLPADWDLAPLPDWVTAACRTGRSRATIAATQDLDLPGNVRRAEVWLTERTPAIESQGGDAWTYQTACGVLNFGLSAEAALDLMYGEWNARCEPPWDYDDLGVKVANAWNYEQNEPGAWGVGDLNQTHATHIAELAASMPDSPFRVHKLREYIGQPPPEYWDDNAIFLKRPAVYILYGASGHHKTNVALTMLLDIVLKRHAKVIYAAGEGARGIGEQRMPAQLMSRGIEAGDDPLPGNFGVIEAAPLFSRNPDVVAFIDEARADPDIGKPDFVVIDTLATALAGEDENGSIAASYLTANGPAGHISRQLKATVLMIAHSGKELDRGIRGHSGFYGNVDGVLVLRFDEQTGGLDLYAQKIRDSRDGFHVYFKVPPKGSAEVPVPMQIDETAYRALTRPRSLGGQHDGDDYMIRATILRDLGADSFANGRSEPQFAEDLCDGSRPADEADMDAMAEWRTKVMRCQRALQAGHSKPLYKGKLCDLQVPRGVESAVGEWRWFIVPD